MKENDEGFEGVRNYQWNIPITPYGLIFRETHADPTKLQPENFDELKGTATLMVEPSTAQTFAATEYRWEL